MASVTRPQVLVAIDGHGTFFDTLVALQRYIQRKYGVLIPLKDISRGRAIGSHLTHTQYEQALNAVIANHTYMMRHVRARPGAARVARRMLQDGIFIEIVSSSGPVAGNALRNVLFKRERLTDVSTRILPMHTLKGPVVGQHYHAFLEDNPAQAQSLIEHGATGVFLLTHPANAHAVLPSGIIRVPSFDAFYAHLSRMCIEQPLPRKER